MLFKHIWDLTVGRLLMPSRPSNAGLMAGELVQVGDRIFYRTVDNLNTWEILTTRNAGMAGGPAILGDDGRLPSSVLPASVGGPGSTGQLVLWFGDPITTPTDCLFCDGDQYLRAEFPELFAVIRTRCGRPSDDRYFCVPDYRTMVPLGATVGLRARMGRVASVDTVTRGRDYTPGTHAFTTTGGTFASAMSGNIIVANEVVPGVGTVGVVQRVDILVGGSYTDFGDQAGPSNCGIQIVCPGLAGGTGFTYDIAMMPVDDRYGIVVNGHGSGYLTPPLITITGPTGATAYPIMDGGTVREIVISSYGIGTWVGATVAITGGTPSVAATAVVEIQAGFVTVGSRGGERGHAMIVGELAPHVHSGPSFGGNGARERSGGTGSAGASGTGSAGSSNKVGTAPAFTGCGIYIRAR